MNLNRDRAWRRAQRRRVVARRQSRLMERGFRLTFEAESKIGRFAKATGIPASKVRDLNCRCKNWKHLGRRVDKLKRARQLRMSYPAREWLALLDDASAL